MDRIEEALRQGNTIRQLKIDIALTHPMDTLTTISTHPPHPTHSCSEPGWPEGLSKKLPNT